MQMQRTTSCPGPCVSGFSCRNTFAMNRETTCSVSITCTDPLRPQSRRNTSSLRSSTTSSASRRTPTEGRGAAASLSSTVPRTATTSRARLRAYAFSAIEHVTRNPTILPTAKIVESYLEHPFSSPNLPPLDPPAPISRANWINFVNKGGEDRKSVV